MFQKDGLIRLLYNLLFGVFFLLSAPFYFWKMWRRGAWRKGFGQRFGFYDAQFRGELGQRPRIWLHAVSVGEINVCIPLLQRLRKELPEFRLVVSTTTSTGMAELRKKAPEVAPVYYPVDMRSVVRRAMTMIQPALVVLVEAEIWPNFLWRAQDQGVPVVLANARLSARSSRGYARAACLFREIFSSLAGVGAQSDADARRWIDLGCQEERVQVTGNLKFDAAVTQAPGRVSAKSLLRALGVGIAAPAKIIVAGSTHPGEEFVLGEVFQQLKRKLPELFLIVVPRHMERSRSAEADLRRAGCEVVRRSQLGKPDSEALSGDCLLVDTTGELLDFYAIADAVYVGKSLRVGGGQNPLEPVALGKPVVFGPRMGNFRDIVTILLAEGAARRVSDQVELAAELEKMLTNADLVGSMVEGARTVMKKNHGTLEKTVRIVARQAQKILQKPLDPDRIVP